MELRSLAYIVVGLFLLFNEYMKYQAKNLTKRYIRLLTNDYARAYFTVQSNKTMGWAITIFFIVLIWIPDFGSDIVITGWILSSLLLLIGCTLYVKITKVDTEKREFKQKMKTAVEKRKQRAAEQEMKPIDPYVQRKQEMIARLQKEAGIETGDEEEKFDEEHEIAWMLEYGKRFGFFEDWDLDRMNEFVKKDMHSEGHSERFDIYFLESLIVNSEYGWWHDHRFYSKDVVLDADKCLQRFGLGLEQGTYENDDVEIIDMERKMRKTMISLKESGDSPKEMDRSLEFYFVTVRDVACRINELIDPEGLVFIERTESDDHYDYALVTKNQAQRIIRDSELGFVMPDRSELPDLIHAI